MHIAATHLAPDRCNSAVWCSKATHHSVCTVLGPSSPVPNGVTVTCKLFSCVGLKLGAHWERFKVAALLCFSSFGCPVVARLSSPPQAKTGATGPPSQCHVHNLVSARSPAALGLMSTPMPAAPSCFFPVLVHSKVMLMLGWVCVCISSDPVGQAREQKEMN